MNAPRDVPDTGTASRPSRLTAPLDRVFSRLLALNVLGLLVAGGLAFVWHSLPVFAGVALAAVLGTSALLAAKDAGRLQIGLGFLAVAVVAAVLAEMAQPGWALSRGALTKLALPAGVAGITMVFWDERRSGPRESVQGIAGVTAFVGLLLYALAVVVVGFREVATPAGLVAAEVLAAFVRLSGDAWRWRHGVAASITLTALTSGYLCPHWPLLILPATVRGVHWVVAPLNLPMLIAGVSWLLLCLLIRAGRRQVLIGLVLVLLFAYLGRSFFVEASHGPTR